LFHSRGGGRGSPCLRGRKPGLGRGAGKKSGSCLVRGGGRKECSCSCKIVLCGERRVAKKKGGFLLHCLGRGEGGNASIDPFWECSPAEREKTFLCRRGQKALFRGENHGLTKIRENEVPVLKKRKGPIPSCNIKRDLDLKGGKNCALGGERISFAI